MILAPNLTSHTIIAHLSRTSLKMYDVLPLGVIATLGVCKIPIYRFFSKWAFRDMNLITFTVIT